MSDDNFEAARLASGDKFVAKKLPQYVATLAAGIGSFALGTVLGWSNPSGESLNDSGKFGELTPDDLSWVGSMSTLGCLCAGLTAGIPAEKIGRKWTMFALAPPFVAGWLLMAFASNMPMLLVGRFITGVCGGAFTLVGPVYVSEIAESNIRGQLSNLLTLLLVGGIEYSYIMGALLKYNYTSMIACVFPVALFIVMFFMPESPRYLITKGKEAEARNALKRLRGAEFDGQVEPERKQIEHDVEESASQSATFKDLLAGPILKPTFISLMLMFLQQYGGINAVLFYSNDIFKAAETGIDPNVSTIIIGGVQVVFCGVSTLLIDRLGRKILLIVSNFGEGISLIALGVFFFLKEHEGKGEGLGWLPLTSLVLYIITYNLAMGPLPWTMMGELLPPHVKGLTSSMATALCWGLAFVITKTYPSMLTAMYSYGCYWLFAGIAIFGGVFSLLYIPETKGKSLAEIQALFK